MRRDQTETALVRISGITKIVTTTMEGGRHQETLITLTETKIE
jgi:hypothetical protein